LSHFFHSRPWVRTTNPPEDDSAESSDDRYDDTVELALTEEDTLALSRAAEEDHAETSVDKSALIITGARHRDRSRRSRRWALVLAPAVVIGIVIGVVWGVAADSIPAVTMGVPSPAKRSVKSLEPSVQFSNPFDASEVFEFPPGTSDDQARQSVATILLERAHDRQRANPAKSTLSTPGTSPDGVRTARDPESRAPYKKDDQKATAPP